MSPGHVPRTCCPGHVPRTCSSWICSPQTCSPDPRTCSPGHVPPDMFPRTCSLDMLPRTCFPQTCPPDMFPRDMSPRTCFPLLFTWCSLPRPPSANLAREPLQCKLRDQINDRKRVIDIGLSLLCSLESTVFACQSRGHGEVLYGEKRRS